MNRRTKKNFTPIKKMMKKINFSISILTKISTNQTWFRQFYLSQNPTFLALKHPCWYHQSLKIIHMLISIIDVNIINIDWVFPGIRRSHLVNDEKKKSCTFRQHAVGKNLSFWDSKLKLYWILLPIEHAVLFWIQSRRTSDASPYQNFKFHNREFVILYLKMALMVSLVFHIWLQMHDFFFFRNLVRLDILEEMAIFNEVGKILNKTLFTSLGILLL